MDKSHEHLFSYDTAPIDPSNTLESPVTTEQFSGAVLSTRYDIAQWRRYVQENSGLVFGRHRPPEEPPEKKNSSKTKRPNIPWQWARTVWATNWRKRQSERLEQDMRESRAGVGTFMAMAEYAIGLAASTEPNRNIRHTKRRDMRLKWRRYAHELMGIARS